MTELQIGLVMSYFLIGLFLADTFLVKVDSTYWLFLIFYPIIILGFFAGIIALWITIKLYELEEKLG